MQPDDPARPTFYLGEGFTGRITLPDGSTMTVEPLDQPAPSALPAVVGVKTEPDIDALLRRYGRLNYRVRDLHNGMVIQGYTFYAPTAEDGGNPAVTYLRAVYAGTAHRIALYVNSSSLTSTNSEVQAYARNLPGTELLASGAVFRYNRPDGVTEALMWTAELVRWADGEVQ